MAAFEDKENNNKSGPDFPVFDKGGSSGPAPQPPKTGASNNFGVTYPDSPDFENAKSTSAGFDDFEYGDDSVAGEYEVKESSVFKYGEVASAEAIGAYYGNETKKASNETKSEPRSETRIDRYAKDTSIEEDNIYGYEAVPETDVTLPPVDAVVHSSEIITEPESESQNEVHEEPQSETADKAPLQTTVAELDFEAEAEQEAEKESYEDPIEEFVGKHESQAYEPDFGPDLFAGVRERRTTEDPIVPSFESVLTEDPEIEHINYIPRHRTSIFHTKMPTWSVVVCFIAFIGIVFVYGSALYFDQRKTSRANSGGYVPPTTKEETTTAAEETPEATGTPTPTPEITATPTPEPTETPTPTPSPTPAPKKTQVYWPVAKKATATPTPVATNGNSGENGTGEGGTGSEGTGGGSSEGGNNSGDTNNGSTDTGNGQENTGNENSSSSGDNNTSNNNGSTSDNGSSSSSGSDSGSGNNGQQDNNDSN